MGVIDAGRAVTVIVPTRDRSSFATAAVESVFAQTVSARQIVLVDDGSSSEHAEALRALAAGHGSRIELHRSPRSRGPAAARNLGLERARGEFVLFLDDDDLIHPRFLEDGLALLGRRPDAGAVVFLYECLRSVDDEAPVDNPVPLGFLESRPVSAFLRYLIPIDSCLVRRGAIGDCRFPEALAQGEDTYFWIALAARGCRFVGDPRVYSTVRRHDANLTRSRSRYVTEIQACYEALIADGLIADRRDEYLAHLKLLWFKLRSRHEGWGTHLRRVVSAPDLFAHELGFWLENRRVRKRLSARAATA